MATVGTWGQQWGGMHPIALNEVSPMQSVETERRSSSTEV